MYNENKEAIGNVVTILIYLVVHENYWYLHSTIIWRFQQEKTVIQTSSFLNRIFGSEFLYDLKNKELIDFFNY